SSAEHVEPYPPIDSTRECRSLMCNTLSLNAPCARADVIEKWPVETPPATTRLAPATCRNLRRLSAVSGVVLPESFLSLLDISCASFFALSCSPRRRASMLVRDG